MKADEVKKYEKKTENNHIVDILNLLNFDQDKKSQVEKLSSAEDIKERKVVVDVDSVDDKGTEEAQELKE